MNRTATSTKAISILLAAVLAITLIPSAALPQAYAQAADADAQTQNDATVSDEAQGAQDATDNANGADADAKPERPAGVVSSTERVAEGAAAARADVEMTRASVALTSGEGAMPTVISQSGMSFLVNEDADTVSLTGVDADLDTACLDIPAQITVSGKAYAVTNIRTLLNLGGGVRSF